MKTAVILCLLSYYYVQCSDICTRSDDKPLKTLGSVIMSICFNVYRFLIGNIGQNVDNLAKLVAPILISERKKEAQNIHA